MASRLEGRGRATHVDAGELMKAAIADIEVRGRALHYSWPALVVRDGMPSDGALGNRIALVADIHRVPDGLPPQDEGYWGASALCVCIPTSTPPSP